VRLTDLQNVRQELAGATNVDEAGKADLSDDCAELTGGSRDTMGGGPVAGREDLTGDDEGGGVGTEVWMLDG
jgi:hypothetical protein